MPFGLSRYVVFIGAGAQAPAKDDKQVNTVRVGVDYINIRPA
jgi:hypothetical protein